MCWYITVMLPAEGVEHLREGINALQASDRSRRRPDSAAGIEPVGDEAVPAHCPEDWHAFYVMCGWQGEGSCSCGLYHVPGDDGPTWKSAAEQIASKGRRRGWSEAKIERAIASSLASAPEPEQSEGIRPDVRRMLADLLDHVPRIGVLVQWVGDDSRPLSSSHRTISVSELRTEDAAIADSIVTWITPDRG